MALRSEQAVLFDLGGVLSVDPWQALILTPGRGLADRMGLHREPARAAAESLWQRYALEPDAAEADYWRDFGAAVGATVRPAVVASVENELLRMHPEAAGLLASLAADGKRIGVVSNNTTFWYEKQARAVELARTADPELLFLSFRAGVTKDEMPGLLEVAAAAIPPQTAQLVDDRREYVERARSLGFRAVHYPPDWSRSLAEVVVGS